MPAIINTKLGEHRGKKRVWLEGQKLAREGITPGTKYDLELQDSQIVLRVKDEGRFTVSKKERNGRVAPVIDLTASELADIFDGVEMLRVLVRKGSVLITAHHQQQRVVERVERLFHKLESGEPLATCSLFHGAGGLDKATHSGFKKSGIATSIAVAVEIESKYLEASLANNPELWNDQSIVIESPIEAINLGKGSPQVDVLIGGVPCTGASRSGRSKLKLEFAESHEAAGAMFFSFLEFVKALNPAIVVLENVPAYASTASMTVIRSVLGSLGYTVQERVLDGNDFGVLERRQRLCAVAISKGIEGFDLDAVTPNREKESCINDILEEVPLDSDRWKSFDYLAEKEKRDKAAGKGFSRQLLTGEEAYCGTIGRAYAKCRSTEPFIVHPEQPELSRIFTPVEHCRLKGFPESMIDGLSNTVAHEVLGQSVVFPVFEAVAQALGRSLWKAKGEELIHVEVVDDADGWIDGENFHWATALVNQAGMLRLTPVAEQQGLPINLGDEAINVLCPEGTEISCGHEPCKRVPYEVVGEQLRVELPQAA